MDGPCDGGGMRSAGVLAGWRGGVPRRHPEARRVKRSAGLPLSVGQAKPAVRILIAAVFLVTAAICIAAGVLLAANPAARVVAILLIIPIGLIGLIATLFILAPHSRFGVWLDSLVPLLRNPLVAIGTAMTFWVMAFCVTWIAGVR
jgi:hypothetical protein